MTFSKFSEFGMTTGNPLLPEDGVANVGPEFVELVPRRVGGDLDAPHAHGLAGIAIDRRIVGARYARRDGSAEDGRKVRGAGAVVAARDPQPAQGVSHTAAETAVGAAEVARVLPEQRWQDCLRHHGVDCLVGEGGAVAFAKALGPLSPSGVRVEIGRA